jgi:hypothetical protein
LHGRYNNDTIDQRCLQCAPDDAVTGTQLRETFVHLFWECNYARGVYEMFFEKYERNLMQIDKKKMLFLGIRNGKNDFWTSIRSVTLLYEIWHARNLGKKNSFATIERNLVNCHSTLRSVSSSLAASMDNSNDNWCRTWWPGGRQGRG